MLQTWPSQGAAWVHCSNIERPRSVGWVVGQSYCCWGVAVRKNYMVWSFEADTFFMRTIVEKVRNVVTCKQTIGERRRGA